MTSEDISGFQKLLEEAERDYRNAQSEIDFCEKKQQDILHDMELVEHRYHEIAHLGVELTDIRRRRRAAKNTMDTLSPLLKWKQENSSALNRLQITIGQMRKVEDKQQHQVYYRRVDGEDKGTIIGHRDA